MPWKTSHPHGGKESGPIGRHVDVYHTDASGKRDQPHGTDYKVSHSDSKTVVRDITPPRKSK